MPPPPDGELVPGAAGPLGAGEPALGVVVEDVLDEPGVDEVDRAGEVVEGAWWTVVVVAAACRLVGRRAEEDPALFVPEAPVRLPPPELVAAMAIPAAAISASRTSTGTRADERRRAGAGGLEAASGRAGIAAVAAATAGGGRPGAGPGPRATARTPSRAR